MSKLEGVLREFVEGNPPNQFRWYDMAGHEQLLRRGLQEALLLADPAPVLDVYWELLTRSRDGEEIAHRQLRKLFFKSGEDVNSLYGNACALVATAGAAAAARQGVSHDKAWDELLRWWREGAQKLKRGELMSVVPKVGSNWLKDPPTDPERSIEAAYEAASAETNWPVVTLREWTLYWLSGRLQR